MKEALSNVRIVLVRTAHPGNIGGAARAMKNMGLTDLCLVAPEEFPSHRADWRAVGAVDVLQSATVVADVSSAIDDCGLVIGTSARDRRIPLPDLDAAAAAERVVADMAGGKVAVLFGPEASGLNNEDLRRCHFQLHIPTSEEYPSLNLAMAVQVVAYEIWQVTVREVSKPAPQARSWDMEPASSGDVELFFEHLERTLTGLGFHDPRNPRQLMTRLRRMYGRIRMDRMELNIMRGILNSVDRLLAGDA